MIINILGKREVNFTDDKSGNKISGKSVYYAYSDPRVEGYATDKLFIGSQHTDPFICGHKYRVQYNRYGKVDLYSVEETNQEI